MTKSERKRLYDLWDEIDNDYLYHFDESSDMARAFINLQEEIYYLAEENDELEYINN